MLNVAQFSSEGNFLRCKPTKKMVSTLSIFLTPQKCCSILRTPNTPAWVYRFSHPPGPLVSGPGWGFLGLAPKLTKSCRAGPPFRGTLTWPRWVKISFSPCLPSNLEFVSFFCLGWALWGDDIGGQLTRSMLQGWELKRCGDTLIWVIFLRNLCLLEENTTNHLLETHGIPWVHGIFYTYIWLHKF